MSRELDTARELVKMLEEKENAQAVKCTDNAGMVELSTLAPGKIFKIGENNFIVLEQDKLTMQTKVISKEFMAEDVVFDDNTRDYNMSSVKKLIEGDIQPIIEEAVGAENLIEHEVDLTSVDMQNEFGKCRCKVRLITFDEARQHNDLLVDNDLDEWWWTCTPWSTKERGYEYSAAVVRPSGYIGCFDCNFNDGVRPVCILKSNIFVSKKGE